MDGRPWLEGQNGGDLTEERLRQELNVARARYDLVSAEFHRATDLARSTGLETVDGAFALRQAGKDFNGAFREYRKALDRFYDFVLRGLSPDD